jgi:hypothetical protein
MKPVSEFPLRQRVLDSMTHLLQLSQEEIVWALVPVSHYQMGAFSSDPLVLRRALISPIPRAHKNPMAEPQLFLGGLVGKAIVRAKRNRGNKDE